MIISPDTAAIDGSTSYDRELKIWMGSVILWVARKYVMMNSSKEAMKLKMAPAIRPGRIIGRVTCHSARIREAPRLWAASSAARSKVARLAPTITTTYGMAMVRWARTNPTMVSVSPSQSGTRSRPSPRMMWGSTIGEIINV